MTIRPGVAVIVLSMSVAVLLGLLWASPIRRDKPLPPRMVLQPVELLANGYDTATLRVETHAAAPPRISVLDHSHGASVQEVTQTPAGWQAQIRAGVLPGYVTIRVEIPGLPPATAPLTTRLAAGDSSGDGTPDFLRLEDQQDQHAFRRWFTYLAEVQYFQRPEERPAEINDCAALIRYAYREALRLHDSAWATESRLRVIPGLESVVKYQYPYTPLGAALFRVREGGFSAANLADGAFAQFADVQTLARFNTHFVSRDLTRALPGDLLFFRQDSDHMPFHSMIYLGESQIGRDGIRYIVYHTGPDGADPGEIRRWAVPELLRYPEPQWRPVGSNPAFLGVYRWNILRKTS